MPNTKLTRARFQNHYQYGKMIYLLICVVAGMLADVLFTVTAYRAPDERKVEIELVGVFSNVESADALEQSALEYGQAFELARDEAAGIDTTAEDYELPLELVDFIQMMYDMNGEDAYYDQQRYMVALAANEGDIFFVNRQLMNSMIHEGLAVDLTPYIESGVIDPGERDLSRVTYPEWVEDGQPATGKECVYALQADTMGGLWNEFQYDYTDKYMVLMVYSGNQDTSAAVMQWMIDTFEVPRIVDGKTIEPTVKPTQTPAPTETPAPAETPDASAAPEATAAAEKGTKE